MGVPLTYTETVHKLKGWWGTFPPGLPIHVGDIVQMNSDTGIKRVSSMFNWPGWKEAMPVDSDAVHEETRWAHHAAKTRAGSAEGGVTSAAGGAQAAVKVSFSEAGGFVIEFIAGHYRKMRDVNVAKKAVLGWAKNGEWEKDQVLVTEIVEADPATILISSAKDSSIILNASAAVPENLGGVNLGDPKFGFTASTSQKDVYESVNKKASPLFHCIKISRKWWGKRFAELQGGTITDLDLELKDAIIDTPFDEDV